jgi:hypothetical protein
MLYVLYHISIKSLGTQKPPSSGEQRDHTDPWHSSMQEADEGQPASAKRQRLGDGTSSSAGGGGAAVARPAQRAAAPPPQAAPRLAQPPVMPHSITRAGWYDLGKVSPPPMGPRAPNAAARPVPGRPSSTPPPRCQCRPHAHYPQGAILGYFPRALEHLSRLLPALNALPWQVSSEHLPPGYYSTCQCSARLPSVHCKGRRGAGME